MRADLHVHLGSAGGRPVKIGASPQLTLQALAENPGMWSGMDILGVVDAQVPGVLAQLEELLSSGQGTQLSRGGFGFGNRLLVAGAEMSLGGFHLVAFVPDLDGLRYLSRLYERNVSNSGLSTGSVSLSGPRLSQEIRALGGYLMPAHIFTPYRGALGRGQNPGDILGEMPALVELGLSADTPMASGISVLEETVFLSNSDAHSASRIGREHNLLAGRVRDYEGLFQLLLEGGISANLGLDPRLGKYYRTVCRRCGFSASGHPPPVLSCPHCPSPSVVTGVRDRAASLPRWPDSRPRPPYIHQAPLETLPGIGGRTRDLLVGRMGSEHYPLHQAPLEEIERAGGKRARRAIEEFRKGRLRLAEGGGGRYGSFIRNQSGA